MRKEAWIWDLGVEIFGPEPSIQQLSGLSRRLKLAGVVVEKSRRQGKSAALAIGLEHLPEGFLDKLRLEQKVTEKRILQEPTEFYERLGRAFENLVAINEKLRLEQKEMQDQHEREKAAMATEIGNLREKIELQQEEIRSLRQLQPLPVPALSDKATAALVVHSHPEDKN